MTAAITPIMRQAAICSQNTETGFLHCICMITVEKETNISFLLMVILIGQMLC